MVVCKVMVDITLACKCRLTCGQINHQILDRQYCLHNNKVLKWHNDNTRPLQPIALMRNYESTN